MKALAEVTAIDFSDMLEPGVYVFVVSTNHIREMLFHQLRTHPDLPEFAKIRHNRIWNGVMLSEDIELRLYCLADLPEKMMGLNITGYFLSAEVKRMAYDDPKIYMLIHFLEERLRTFRV